MSFDWWLFYIFADLLPAFDKYFFAHRFHFTLTPKKCLERNRSCIQLSLCATCLYSLLRICSTPTFIFSFLCYTILNYVYTCTDKYKTDILLRILKPKIKMLRKQSQRLAQLNQHLYNQLLL